MWSSRIFLRKFDWFEIVTCRCVTEKRGKMRGDSPEIVTWRYVTAKGDRDVALRHSEERQGARRGRDHWTIRTVGGPESEDTSRKSPYRCECEEALIGVSSSALITASLFQHVHHSPQRRRSLFALGPYTLQSHSIPQVIGTAPSGSHVHPAGQHGRYFR